jgi:hypothetical protein
MKKYLFFLLILLSLTSVKCSKQSQEDQLPPITTTGANTFGCKVDGKVWLPYGAWNINALTVNENIKNYSINGVQIYASNRKNQALSDVDITLKGINVIGNYKIYNYLNTGLLYSDGSISYEPFDTFGIVNISRFDTTAKIISGTFSFIGYTDHTHTKQVSITDGRFDLHYPLTIRLH